MVGEVLLCYRSTLCILWLNNHEKRVKEKGVHVTSFQGFYFVIFYYLFDFIFVHPYVTVTEYFVERSFNFIITFYVFKNVMYNLNNIFIIICH